MGKAAPWICNYCGMSWAEMPFACCASAEFHRAEFRLYTEREAGKDGYPWAWHEYLKHAHRELAGHRCERCKHPYKCGEHGNGEWTPCDEQCSHPKDLPSDMAFDPLEHEKLLSRWRILTVHHLDGNKLNCEAWNLAALCQKCHLTIQGRVKMDQMFFAELLDVSEWFKPHLAGYIESLKKRGLNSQALPLTPRQFTEKEAG